MKNIYSFSIVQVLFFSVMWMSKTLHPIYFESAGYLAHFGLSYSAMALAGYFSFLTGSISDRLGFSKTLGLGFTMYGIGLLLRGYPDSSFVSITSGIIAGLGASMALTAIRIWMLELATPGNQAKWVGIKSSTTALGTAIGCSLAGLLPSFSYISISIRHILLASGVIIIALGCAISFFTKKTTTVNTKTTKSPWADLKDIFLNHRKLALFTSLIGVMTGFYVSFVSPYLPLIMKQKGLSMSSIGLSIGAFSLVRFIADPLIAKWINRKSKHTLFIFLAAEFSILLVTGFFAITISKEIFVVFLIVRSLSLGFSTISEELLWIQKFPKALVGLLFGVNQSAFFLGDFLGGLLNGVIYQKFGLGFCVLITLLAIIINAYLFITLFKKNHKTVPAEIFA